jgi:hypothetical protein
MLAGGRPPTGSLRDPRTSAFAVGAGFAFGPGPAAVTPAAEERLLA